MERIRAEEFWERAENNEMAELDCLPEGLRVLGDLTYAVTDRRGLLLDAYFCEPAPTQARPAVLFLHGGGWLGGSKKQFARQAAYLASKHGFFAVCCEYRFSHEARFPACLRDAKCAVKWVRAKGNEFNVDPERLAIAGGSAGGHLAAMVATTADVAEYEAGEAAGGLDYADQPAHVNLCIPHNAPLDLVALAEKGGQADKPVRELLGGSLGDMPDAYRDGSPFHRAGPETPPMLLLHGGADTTIPCEQSVALHEKLLSLGVRSELEIYPGKGHGWFNRAPDFAEVLTRMEAFLVAGFGLA